MIFQIHEKHGKHIAYLPQEAEANKKTGWKTVTREEYKAYGKKVPDKSVAAVEGGNVQETGEETSPAVDAVPKKRGRKPKVDGYGA